MKNNLEQIERHLRSMAKRYKSVKYSLGLAILFLMMGINIFSEEVMTQETVSRERIQNSVGNLQTKINDLKSQNDKQLNGLRLELIQLMEQGNQVVKSPWSSWQFGINYMYSKWNGVYKGRGDKKNWPKDLRENFADPLKRFVKNDSVTSSTYGLTTLNILYEPPAEITVSAGIRPKSINKEAPSYSPVAPAGALPPFEPKLISPPAKPAAPREVTPVTFSPPDINFKGKGFGQGALIGMPRLQNSENVVIQNYDSYDTVDKNTAAKGIFNIEVGNLGGGVKARWWGSNLDGTANPNVQMKAITNVPNTATPGLTRGGFNAGGVGTFWLGDGNTTFKGMNAFINELRDHNATISGNYVLTNRGGEGVQANRIFLSHNPAGVGGGTGAGTPGGPYDGQAQPLEKTATFNGTLTLHGTPNAFTGNTAHSDVTIGVEHQLWSQRTPGDWITTGAFSTFNNTGKITLASGNNLVGILIDVEAWNNNDGPAHKTKNNGTIEITNAQNSIGIDFGLYAIQNWLPLDVTLGNIIVKGENNYGFRMKNIGQDTYYDDVTISGGGSNKTITVAGKHNVGLAIGKSLSANPQPYTEAGNLNHGTLNKDNPISNFHGVNVNVMGEETVGFLRLADSYTGNTKDFILTDGTGKNDTHATMGTFTFGNGAKKSTLIRTDKYGIQVRGNITAVGKNDTGVGNTVLHSNGETQHINNYKTITIGKGFTQTTGMAATGSTNSTIVNILNEGTISLQGKKSIGMYVDKFTQGKSTGTIKLSGVGDTDKSGKVGDAENVGISNKGKFTFSGTLEVNGKKSSGIYNTGETTIAVGANPTDKTNITVTNGATALYSKGVGTKIESTAGNKLNVTVNAGTTKEGLAVYAEDKSEVKLHNANINVVGGSAGVAAYDANTKIDLTGSTLKLNPSAGDSGASERIFLESLIC